jgi:hypothetical protein
MARLPVGVGQAPSLKQFPYPSFFPRHVTGSAIKHFRWQLTARGYPPICTIVLEAGTKSGSPM